MFISFNGIKLVTVKLIVSDPENELEGIYEIEWRVFVTFIGDTRKIISFPKFPSKKLLAIILFVLIIRNKFISLFTENEKDPSKQNKSSL